MDSSFLLAIFAVCLLPVAGITLRSLYGRARTENARIGTQSTPTLPNPADPTSSAATRAPAPASNSASMARQARPETEILVNTSHELRTPLNAIIGFSDVLLHQQFTDESERTEYVRNIRDAGVQLLAVIDDILEIARIESNELEVAPRECQPAHIIEEVVSLMRVRAVEKGLHLESRWLTGVPQRVQTDPGRLRQLLVNVIGNAIKFTDSGLVSVEASVEPDRQTLQIDIVDEGIGIPADKLESVFSPFTQADGSLTRKYDGAGLGLAISRKIARALGGDLVATSTQGQGSRFRVTLQTGSLENVHFSPPPLPSPNDASNQHRTEQQPLANTRVLIADDGISNRKFLSLMLRKVGAEVTCAEHGAAALQHFDAGPDFDAVLMDMHMPVMDGFEATRLLRNRGFPGPILAITGQSAADDWRDVGCSASITKPIAFPNLLHTLLNLLRNRQGSENDEGADSSRDPLMIASTLPTDDPEFLEIVEEFIETMHRRFETLQAAVQMKDFETVATEAHWLKGAAGTAGFGDFTEPSRILVEAARQANLQAATQQVELLGDLMERVVARLPEQA